MPLSSTKLILDLGGAGVGGRFGLGGLGTPRVVQASPAPPWVTPRGTPGCSWRDSIAVLSFLELIPRSATRRYSAPDLPDRVSPTTVRDLPSTRAGGQDDVSSKQTLSNQHTGTPVFDIAAMFDIAAADPDKRIYKDI